jgi:hypothetical protein
MEPNKPSLIPGDGGREVDVARHLKRMNYQIPIIALCAALLLGCGGCGALSTNHPGSPVTTAEKPGGLSPEAISTLSSLEKVDEYPFYVMHFAGNYAYQLDRNTWTDAGDLGCSLFAALNTQGDRLYGRNFDWDYSPALLVFTDPPEGYASASMVDLTFIGIDPRSSKSLLELPLEQRTDLLDAPSMPFDGMNEYGLAIGMAAVPEEFLDDASDDSSRRTIGSIGIIRQVLDHAKNVDEAIGLFKLFNIEFRGGPPIHYLLADRGGNAALIEFYKGEMVVLPNENPWHLATNHLRCIAEGDGGCPRYRTLSERLVEINGLLDPAGAMQLLSQVQQDMTQWSAVYDMTSGEIQVVIAGAYQTSYSFHLDLLTP